MTTCPACHHDGFGVACSRCGFVSADLATSASSSEQTSAQADSALFDVTVARPVAQTATIDASDRTVTRAVIEPAPDWASAPPPWSADPGASTTAATSTTSTVVAHLVLWLGVLLVAVSYSPLLQWVFTDLLADAPSWLPLAVLGAYPVLPLAAALIVGARGSALRVAAAVGAVVVVGAAVTVAEFGVDTDAWPVSAVGAVGALATWMVVRRHARPGFVLLVPAALVAVGWFAPFGPGPSLRAFPYRHGVTSDTLSVLWTYLPLAALAVLGLVSALLRPRPSAAGDRAGWVVVAPLAALTVLAAALVPVLYGHDDGGSSPGAAADYSQVGPDPVVAARTYLDAAASGQTSVAGCNGDVPAPSVASYTIGQVSPATTGGFDVSATVTAADGSVQVVTIHVGPAASNASTSCVSDVSVPDYSPSTQQAAANGFPAPSVPSSSDPVPSGTTVPEVTVGGDVIPYTDAGRTPTTEGELVAHEPDGLTPDQQAAVQALIRFLTAINQQDFQAAWSASTYSTKAASYSAAFAAGYATSRHFEVSFGQPQQLTPTLVAVPATFVSRQDPAAQGNPAGVTSCTYWPQYVFLAASVGGTWLDDTAGVFAGDPSVAALKRLDPSRPGKSYLNPLSQRVAC